MKIQAHELSVPYEMFTEPSLPSYCVDRRLYVNLACPSILSVIPSTIIDYHGSLLCNCKSLFLC